jgi:hypothetical protein
MTIQVELATIAIAALAVLGACDRSVAHHPELTSGRARQPAPGGTTIRDRLVAMELSVADVEKWYRTLALIGEYTERNRVGLRLDFELDSTVSGEARRLEQVPWLVELLRQKGMSVERFVELSSQVTTLHVVLGVCPNPS